MSETLHDHAAELMLNAARDVQLHAIEEHLADYNGGGPIDAMTVVEVSELISTASVTIEWPEVSDGTVQVGGAIGRLVDALRAELEHVRVERDELWDRVDGEAWDRLRAEVERLRAENAKAGRQALIDYRDANHRHNDRAPGWCICGEEWDADADLRCAEYEGLTDASPGGA